MNDAQRSIFNQMLAEAWERRVMRELLNKVANELGLVPENCTGAKVIDAIKQLKVNLS